MILGRETNLCRAEIEAIAQDVSHLDGGVSLVSDAIELDINHAGGIVKIAQVITRTSGHKAATLASDIQKLVIEFIKSHQLERKVSFGISLYGDKITCQPLIKKNLGLGIKKQLVAEGISCRYVMAKNGHTTSAAQVNYNSLLGPGSKGFDFVCYASQKKLILGYTTAVQDIASYTKRDFKRPCRDMVTGMLPPKLAQIMINLAHLKNGQVIVDPFCGSGVILQEALLMGYDTHGSDMSDKMVRCSQNNLTWLRANYKIASHFRVSQADATTISTLPQNCAIVTEGYLGKPLSQAIDEADFLLIQKELTNLYLVFFENLSLLKHQPSIIVISLPVWRAKTNILTLEIIDQIEDLGYTLEQFAGQNVADLIYLRDNQFVGRQVLVLSRKAT